MPPAGGPDSEADETGSRNIRKPPPKRKAGPRRAAAPPGGRIWLYGRHAVLAALANPRRRVRRLLATPEAADELRSAAPAAQLTEASRDEIARRLPPGAVHQGFAAEVEPLPEIDVDDVCRAAALVERTAVVVLDMVTDPQNVGAVLRSAAAFAAAAVLLPERGAPEATGALAKAASGALERVPLVHAANLRRALDTLKAAGFWCVGLAGDAERDLGTVDFAPRTALVLGAEGTGLRRLTRETCDLLARIPIAASVESLNVSAAAAVALYEWRRRTS